MTLLEIIRTNGGSEGILRKIDDFRAKPVPYTFVEGKIPRHALYQRTFWRDRTGKLYEISEMAPMHARNALKKLWGAYHEDSTIDIEKTKLYTALAVQACKGF